jgi:hypothetical protein
MVMDAPGDHEWKIPSKGQGTMIQGHEGAPIMRTRNLTLSLLLLLLSSFVQVQWTPLNPVTALAVPLMVSRKGYGLFWNFAFDPDRSSAPKVEAPFGASIFGAGDRDRTDDVQLGKFGKLALNTAIKQLVLCLWI